MKNKWITKAEIMKILSAYSIRKDEFKPVRNNEYFLQSQIIRGYTISIEQEKYKNKDLSEATGRIIITHSQYNGKKTYQDVWQRDQNGTLQFRFRNLCNQPLSDADYIRELENQNQLLNQARQNLQEQLSSEKSQKLINDTFDAEMQSLKNKFDDLSKKYQKLKNNMNIHNARGAGRKPSKERQDSINRVKDLIDSGYSDQDIIAEMGISRATFYRYKKSIKNSNVNIL